MHRLRDAGNTLVVVEHDPAVMLAADRLIDMGPGPGERGGEIVFDGTPEAVKSADTLTGAYLGARKQVGMGLKRLVGDSTPRLILEGARDHNLKDITVEFPLLHLVCVTGVSGSGKSTLIQDILAPALARHFGKATETPGAHDALHGADWLGDTVFVDQSPIGKTARSNPASYVGAFDEIRKLFAHRAAGGAARLRRRHVQLQRRQRPLPDLRRLGLRARRDAVPQRRVPALPGLRRPPLPRRDPRRHDRAPAARRRRRAASASPTSSSSPSPRRCSCSATTARWCAGCSRSSTSASST